MSKKTPKKPFSSKQKDTAKKSRLSLVIERPFIAATLLLLWSLLFLLPGIFALPVADRDEAKFGRAAIEMAERNDWFVPTFGNDFISDPDKELVYDVDPESGKINKSDYRFDKPIGVYWLMRASLALFGEKALTGNTEASGPFSSSTSKSDSSQTEYLASKKTAAALRLPSILSTWVVALVILGLGRQMYSKKAAFWAAFAWCSCLQVLIHGRLIVADMPMIAAVASALWAAWNLLFSEFDNNTSSSSAAKKSHWNNGWWWLWMLSLTWGFLVKGPIAWLIPLLTLVLARWALIRSPLEWKKLAPISTLLFVFALVCLWAIPANLATDWNYTKEGLGLHVVERGLSPMNGRWYIPVLPYLLFAPLSLLPWGAFLPVALQKTAQETKQDPRRGFLLAWFIAPYLVFIFYATQLPHYVLPGFPAFFLLLTRNGWPKAESKFAKIWLVSTWILTITIAAIVLFFCLKINWNPAKIDPVLRSLLDLKQLLYALAALLVLFATSALLIQTRRSILPLLACLGLSTFVTHELSFRLQNTNPTLALAQRWRNLNDVKHLRAWKYHEPSLIYYSGKPWSMGGEKETAKRWLSNLDDQVLVVENRRWKLNWPTLQALLAGKTPPPADDHSAFFEEVSATMGMRRAEPIMGYNAAQTAWVELYLITPVEQTATLEQQLQEARQLQN